MAPFLLAITGPTAAGKSYFSKKLRSHMEKIGYSIVTLSTDEFYYDLSHLTMEERTDVNYDDPASIDNDEFLNVLSGLVAGETVEVPIYDFSIHCRTGKFRKVKPADLIVVEGIFSLSFEEVNPLYDISIYLDLANDLRLIRRVRRDMKERDRSLESVFDQYLNQVRPSQKEFVHQDKDLADFILLGDKDHSRVIDLISAGIHMKMGDN